MYHRCGLWICSLLVLSSLLVLVCSASATLQQNDETGVLRQEKKDCPNYQYKCPDCPIGTRCVYPNSGGCDGAGIPVCQSQFCHGAVCLIKALPCSEECPYSCEYTGPKCCPFIGQPECHTCETFAPCHETPCPDECPDSCFYPDADWCCPKSGEPICRKNANSTTLAPSIASSTVANTGSTPLLSTQAQRETMHENKKRAMFDIPSSMWKESKWFYQPTKSQIVQSSAPSPVPVAARPSSSASPWFYQPIKSQDNVQESATAISAWFHQPSNGSPKPASSWFSQPNVAVSSQPQFSYVTPRMPLPSMAAKNSKMKPSAWFFQPSKSPETSKHWFYQPHATSKTNDGLMEKAEPTPPFDTIRQRCDFPCPDIPVPTWGTCTVYQEPHECCPRITCVGIPASIDPTDLTTPVTTILSAAPTAIIDEEDPIICADYIYPCPPECPESCNYPKNVPCPYQYKPACPPTEPIISTTCIETEIFSTPVAITDPLPPTTIDTAPTTYYTTVTTVNPALPVTFTKVSTITLTTTVEPSQRSSTTTEDPVMCPMIVYMCPPECPDNCIRPSDVPCPYAVPPRCPRSRHH